MATSTGSVPAVSRFGGLGRSSRVLFVVPGLLFFAATWVYPLVELVRMSVSQVTAKNILGEWPVVGADNYASVVGSSGFHEALGNTLLYTLVVVTVGVVGGTAAGIVLHRDGWISRLTLTLLLLVWALPPVVSGSLWRFLFSSGGVINEALVNLGLVEQPILFITDASLVLVSVAMVTAWVTLPFVAVVVRAAMLDLPSEVLEAALVDGASPWQSLRHVTLPLLAPAIAVASVLVVVYAFRSFDFIYTMTSGGPGTASTTLPYLAYKLAFGSFRFSAGAAVAVIAGMFVLVLAVVYSRNLAKGDRT